MNTRTDADMKTINFRAIIVAAGVADTILRDLKAMIEKDALVAYRTSYRYYRDNGHTIESAQQRAVESSLEAGRATFAAETVKAMEAHR